MLADRDFGMRAVVGGLVAIAVVVGLGESDDVAGCVGSKGVLVAYGEGEDDLGSAGGRGGSVGMVSSDELAVDGDGALAVVGEG